ncbi:MAG: TonB-dependent receptor plug domain-containing protein [Muribaculum sp.]|nr:TonB-dependent receptor plug domain-containing protein [Muribaculum sp.]
MKRLTLALVALAMAMAGSAEQLQGVVVNQKGKPQKKVKVYSRATKMSAFTNDDGMFILVNLSPDDTVAVCNGKTKEARFPAAGLSEITVTFDKKNFLLSDGQTETAYEYTKIKAPHRQPNVITREQVEESNAETLYDLLRGRLSGVMVSGTSVVVRGANSINMNNEPILVVDGMVYGGAEDVNRAINVRDIQKVEVVTEGLDYGTRGANGAIIITTMRTSK